MRVITKVLTAATAVGLAATMAACSSSGPSTDPVGQFKTLSGNTTTVVPASSFTAALKSLSVTLAPEGKAKSTSEGIAFPITGGNATIYNKGAVTPYVTGTIKHAGSGLTLTAGSTVVTLENFVIDPGNNSNLTGDVLVDGKAALPTGTKLFDLNGNTLKTPTISKSSVATLSGTEIYVSQAAAKALNGVFKLTGSKALPTGFEKILVGTAIVRATGS